MVGTERIGVRLNADYQLAAKTQLVTDTVSWMVVAERDDPTYLASTITDDDGLLIIEAEKPEDVEDGELR